MPNPFGLIGGGLKRTGGLLGSGLQTLGRNFDKNAAGGIDIAMGDEYTPEMRRGMRGNAVMAMGQMLATQGRTPIQEGLQKGQQQALGAWKIGQERKQQKEGQAVAADVARQLSLGEGGGSQQAPTPINTAPVQNPGLAPGMPNIQTPPVAPPPDPAAMIKNEIAKITGQAKMFRNIAIKYGAIGNNKVADKYMADALDAEKLVQQYQLKLFEMAPQETGALTEAMVDGKRAYLQNVKGGAPKVFGGGTPLPQYENVNVKDKILRVDKTAAGPEGGYTIGRDPNDVIQAKIQQDTLNENIAENQRNFPLRERQVAASESQANTARGNLTVHQAQLEIAQAKEMRDAIVAKAPKTLSGDAAKTYAIASTMQPELQALRQAYVEQGVAASRGISKGTNRVLIDLVDSISDKIGRLRSGGAIGEVEAERFLSQIHHWTNSLPFSGPQDSIKGIDRLMRESQLVIQGIDPTGSMSGGKSAAPIKNENETDAELEKRGVKWK